MDKITAIRRLAFGIITVSFLMLGSCTNGPSNIFPVHVRYWSQFDANELWLVHYDSKGNKITSLIRDDLTKFIPGVIDYRQEFDVYIARRHDPADEPNITPYYYFEYVQQKLELNGEAIYRDAPVESEAFAVHVNHLGAGYSLLDEWMLIYDAFPVEYRSMFKQYYCGPELKIHEYRPSMREDVVVPTACEHPTPTPTVTPYPSKTWTLNPDFPTLTPTGPLERKP